MRSRTLFEPMALGTLHLANRVVMAPMTRSRATQDSLPTDVMVEYYRQRAGAGLVISEGTVVSAQGVSYPRVPGLYSREQVNAWKPVTDAVHEAGGVIFAQLWHVGRQSHSSVQPDGLPPWAPSAVAIENYHYYRKPEKVPYETPRELSVEGIRDVINDFTRAAVHAMEAGFDGVELHGANGYLIDQFLNSGSNRRTDQYGGALENRGRFLHELLESIGQHVPLNRVAVRLSPSSTWMDALDDDKAALHSHVVSSLNRFGLAYLHLVEPGISGATSEDSAGHAVPSDQLSALFDGPVILTGDHSLESAQEALGRGRADLVGYGRTFISNPDLPQRLLEGAPLLPSDKKGFYSDGVDGYLTYPSLAEERRWAELAEDFARDPVAAEALHQHLQNLSELELARTGQLYIFNQLDALLSTTTCSA